MENLKLPVGVSEFEKIRENGYYYIDKSGLIIELLKEESTEVTLITRPRRFGKTLGMSMLESFFDIQRNSVQLFQGLKIAEKTELCHTWMNQWPTIFISFRCVDGLDFTGAYDMLTMAVSETCKKHLYLLDSDRVSEFDKAVIRRLVEGTASLKEIKSSLMVLTRVMEQHYQKKVILLMDEYDVPVAKASSHGYYEKMLDVMKGMMQSLKDNASLRFAVVTGCLKIAKESIFTGTNNFVSDTITDSRLDEYFGFTEEDVTLLLQDADALEHAKDVQTWYDGYHFGNMDVYCPWDVMNYVQDIQRNPQAKPSSYWKNTSDNAIIRSFIDVAGNTITRKLETLLSGGYIAQKIDENLTYDYLHTSEDNLWSMLYLSGYLTRVRENDLTADLPDQMIALKIPNLEIREIFETTVVKWFDDTARTWNRKELFNAVWKRDVETMTEEMNKLLRRTISYHDYKEDFYHAFLAGIFTGAGYIVESNREHGEGRSDITVFDPVNSRVAVFEVKNVQKAAELEDSCDKALRQIDERMYAAEYEDEYEEILCYGVSFFKKRCLVMGKSVR